MRIPWAAVILTWATAAVYWQSSGGQLYPDFQVVYQNSYGLGQPLALVFHLFYHLGLKHLVGNLIPLFAFSFLLGLYLAWWEIVLLFLLSGLSSALVFSLLNPASFLVGASSGVSALMTAAALVRPKLGVVMLIAVPLLTFGAVFPMLDQTAATSFKALEEKKDNFEKLAFELEKQNRFDEAKAARLDAEKTAGELGAQKEGKSREEAARSDFLVHLTGALLGAAFVLWRHPDRLEEGMAELWPLFNAIKQFFSKS